MSTPLKVARHARSQQIGRVETLLSVIDPANLTADQKTRLGDILWAAYSGLLNVEASMVPGAEWDNTHYASACTCPVGKVWTEVGLS